MKGDEIVHQRLGGRERKQGSHREEEMIRRKEEEAKVEKVRWRDCVLEGWESELVWGW